MNEVQERLEQFKATLAAVGISDQSDQEIVLQQIGDIIARKIITDYLTKLPEEIAKKLESIPSNEVMAYIQDNSSSLPEISEESAALIAEATIRDFFETIAPVES